MILVKLKGSGNELRSATFDDPLNIRCLVCGEPAVETPNGNTTCARAPCMEKFFGDLGRLLDKAENASLEPTPPADRHSDSSTSTKVFTEKTR